MVIELAACLPACLLLSAIPFTPPMLPFISCACSAKGKRDKDCISKLKISCCCTLQIAPQSDSDDGQASARSSSQTEQLLLGQWRLSKREASRRRQRRPQQVHKCKQQTVCPAPAAAPTRGRGLIPILGIPWRLSSSGCAPFNCIIPFPFAFHSALHRLMGN